MCSGFYPDINDLDIIGSDFNARIAWFMTKPITAFKESDGLKIFLGLANF